MQIFNILIIKCVHSLLFIKKYETKLPLTLFSLNLVQVTPRVLTIDIGYNTELPFC